MSKRPLVELNNLPLPGLGQKTGEARIPIETVHDYKMQQGSPEEEAGWGTSEYGDKYRRYPVMFPSLWQLAVKEDAPEWIDIAASGISEFLTAFLFSLVVNQAIAWLRIAGGTLALPVHGIVVGIAAGFMAFALTALFGHHSVRLNPWVIFIEACMPHHWAFTATDRTNGPEKLRKLRGNNWAWNIILSVALIGLQFLGYWAGTASQNHMTDGQAPLTGATCNDAGSPIQDAATTANRAFFIEFIGSFVIALAWFCSSLESRGSFNAGPMRSWVIGCAHFVSTSFAYAQTTAIFNPSRYLASAATLGTFCSVANGTDWLVYIFGSGAATAFAAIVFLFVTRKTSQHMEFGKRNKEETGFVPKSA